MDLSMFRATAPLRCCTLLLRMQPWESRTHGLRQCIHRRAQGFLLDSCNFLTHGRRCRGNFLNIPRQGYRPEGAWHNHTKVLKSYGTVRISCRLDAWIVDYYLLRVTKTFSKNRQSIPVRRNVSSASAGVLTIG